jgi:hypothetical protein
MYRVAAGLPPTLAQFEGSTPIAMNVIPILIEVFNLSLNSIFKYLEKKTYKILYTY